MCIFPLSTGIRLDLGVGKAILKFAVFVQNCIIYSISRLTIHTHSQSIKTAKLIFYSISDRLGYFNLSK